ncbi:MAG TPA: class I SAM-dependent methyltransferase [Bacteroidota bacterium]|nr:class I SAM-dependent methyltransferase [Bacteroidota bacterium]
MSSCCTSSVSCEGTNRFFSKFSKRYAKQFKKKGLEKIQKYLLEGVRTEPVQSKRVLDIGCGVGGLHLTLLQEGAAYAVGVDAAEGMVSKAMAFARELGLAEKAEHILGDFVEQAASIGEADITLMDKVVCCYGDLDTLIRVSASKTKRTLGLTHPSNNVLVRWFFKSHIAVLKLFKAKFHPFWHDWNVMDQTIRSLGFQPLYTNSTFLWQARVYRRSPS